MNTFHGYPIPDVRHPVRVNWIRNVGPHWVLGWKRVDDMHAESSYPSVEEMERIDRETPMPRPPVLVGQVWRLTGGDVPREVLITEALVLSGGRLSEPRIPDGSDLVWGPFAPWQDTREAP